MLFACFDVGYPPPFGWAGPSDLLLGGRRTAADSSFVGDVVNRVVLSGSGAPNHSALIPVRLWAGCFVPVCFTKADFADAIGMQELVGLVSWHASECLTPQELCLCRLCMWGRLRLELSVHWQIVSGLSAAAVLV